MIFACCWLIPLELHLREFLEPGFTVPCVVGHLHFLLPGCMTNQGHFTTILLTSWERGWLAGSVSSSYKTPRMLVRIFRHDFPQLHPNSPPLGFFSLPPGDVSLLGFCFIEGFCSDRSTNIKTLNMFIFWTCNPTSRSLHGRSKWTRQYRMFPAALFITENSEKRVAGRDSWTSIRNEIIDYFIWRDVHNILLSEESKIQDVIDNVLFFLAQGSLTFLVKQNLGFPFESVVDWMFVSPLPLPAKFMC